MSGVKPDPQKRGACFHILTALSLGGVFKIEGQYLSQRRRQERETIEAKVEWSFS
jgi:hypothetical protein